MTHDQASAQRRLANLAGWMNEPYVQEPVIAALRAAGMPLALREVADQCDIPISSANRVLLRLHAKGLVSRYKLPMQRHAYCRRRRTCIVEAATRMLYLYSWVGTGRATG